MVDRLTDVRLTPEGVEVIFDDGVSATLSGRWLRDHADDTSGRDPHTGQRLVETFALPPDLMPSEVGPSEERTRLAATWPEHRGLVHDAVAHPSVVTSAAATAIYASVTSASDGTSESAPWRLPTSVELWPEPRATSSGATTIDHIRQYGWAVVASVAPGRDAVYDLADTLGGVQSTIFGEVWELSAEVTDHADSAYDTTFLGPHTDATYLDDAPRLQVFVCQGRKGTGGASILVDGFAAAGDLREANAEAVDLLAAVAVPGRYVEPGVDCCAERPTLRVAADGELEQISFNNLDRAPFWLPAGRWDRWLDAYGALNQLLVDERRWLRVPVQPGQALIIDNWRVLHGREAFTGTRRFLGCYVSNGSFTAAA